MNPHWSGISKVYGVACASVIKATAYASVQNAGASAFSAACPDKTFTATLDLLYSDEPGMQE